jgi:hypothetical protein
MPHNYFDDAIPPNPYPLPGDCSSLAAVLRRAQEVWNSAEAWPRLLSKLILGESTALAIDKSGNRVKISRTVWTTLNETELAKIRLTDRYEGRRLSKSFWRPVFLTNEVADIFSHRGETPSNVSAKSKNLNDAPLLDLPLRAMGHVAPAKLERFLREQSGPRSEAKYWEIAKTEFAPLTVSRDQTRKALAKMPNEMKIPRGHGRDAKVIKSPG